MMKSLDYSKSRGRLLKWVKTQLIGGEELADGILNESNPFDRYFTGILYPISESRSQEDVEVEIDNKDDNEATPVKKTSFYQPPSSMGFSFYMQGGKQSLDISFKACFYKKLPKINNKARWKKEELHSDSYKPLQFTNTSSKSFDGKVKINVIFRNYDKGQIVTVTLTNIQVLEDVDKSKKREESARKSLFEVELECLIDDELVLDYPSTNKALLSNEEKEIELRYKDVRVYAVGHGVAVDWKKKQGLLSIFSDFMPTVQIPQVTTDLSNGTDKVLAFDFLREIETNPSVIKELNLYVNEYDQWIKSQQKKANIECGDDRETSDRIVKNMLVAKQRMEQGVLLLDRDPLAKKAFSVANYAMLAQMQRALKSKNKKAYGWRPFQLAFILMALESTVNEDSDFRDIVDLIWFPTGGGKTEAYLGLMAFIFSYRRMRYPASSGGTTAIMRYTLRLLTAQQFVRACQVISALELIRQSDSKTLGSEPFTVGLWLGTASSPNTFAQAMEKANCQQYSKLVLTSCPWCQEEFGRNNYICSDSNFHFTCLNNNCDFGKNANNVLPYNVVDEALYKSPPSLLIATVDKFARLAWEDRAASFFGKGANRPPELIIQDELHLISGAIGSIVGLYEVGFETILLAKGIRVKYVASTATIKNASQQIKALFARNMSVFPPVGLRHNDSYFAKTVSLKDKPGRIYIGYMDFRSAKVKALEPLAGALLAAPSALFSNDEIFTDAWWTQVVYHGSLKGVGNSRTNYQSGALNYYNKLNELSFLNDINKEAPGVGVDIKKSNRLISDKYPLDINGDDILMKIHDQYYPARELTIKSLSSNQTAQENADIFNALGSGYDDNQSIDVALATNMISVGLDVSRLALMIINGQPLTTAEYIQASSRVGRGDVPGVVFANYYKTQARSISHYENFKSYHTTFYRYVEPSSVTPFTFQVRKKALHAAIVIAMRHSNIGLLDNKGAENFNSDQVEVKKILRLLKIRLQNASSNKELLEETLEHVDSLINEWTLEVERCNEERLNLRFNPKDGSSEALLSSFENKAKAQGMWKTLNSMRNVEKTGLFKIVRGLKNEEF